MDKQGCLSGMGVWPLENDHSPEQEAGAGRWGGADPAGSGGQKEGTGDERVPLLRVSAISGSKTAS